MLDTDLKTCLSCENQISGCLVSVGMCVSHLVSLLLTVQRQKTLEKKTFEATRSPFFFLHMLIWEKAALVFVEVWWWQHIQKCHVCRQGVGVHACVPHVCVDKWTDSKHTHRFLPPRVFSSSSSLHVHKYMFTGKEYLFSRSIWLASRVITFSLERINSRMQMADLTHMHTSCLQEQVWRFFMLLFRSVEQWSESVKLLTPCATEIPERWRHWWK